jgi:hypothetical protein
LLTIAECLTKKAFSERTISMNVGMLVKKREISEREKRRGLSLFKPENMGMANT